MNATRPIVGRVPLRCLILFLIATISGVAVARDLPTPPCAGPPMPAYPSTLDTAVVNAWLDAYDLEDWQAHACLKWEDRPATVLIAVASRFRHDGSLEELLARLGAVSRYTSIRHWSWSRQRWRNLFEESVALSAPVRTAERPDFKADEFREGDQLFVLQNESGPVSEVIQRVSIIDRTEDGIEIGITNLSPARIALLTLFGPGGSDMRLWIEREAEDRWTYFSLTRLSGSTMLARPTLERSYVNRAKAMFRYLIGTERQQDKP